MTDREPMCTEGPDHDLVRDYYVPSFEFPPPEPVRYLRGIECARCGFRPIFDAGNLSQVDEWRARSRDPEGSPL